MGLLMEWWPVIHPMKSLPFLPQPSTGGFMGMMGVGCEGGYLRSSSVPRLLFTVGALRSREVGTGRQTSGPHPSCGASVGAPRSC